MRTCRSKWFSNSPRRFYTWQPEGNPLSLPAIVKVLRGEAGDGWVHTVLRIQHVHLWAVSPSVKPRLGSHQHSPPRLILRGLQPLEEAPIIVALLAQGTLPPNPSHNEAEPNGASPSPTWPW